MERYQRSIASLHHQERKALAELLKVLINDSEPIVSRKRLESMIEQLENLGILEMSASDIGYISLLINKSCNKIKRRLGLKNIVPE